MISEKSKKKIKEIKKLKESNWQKNYQTFSMYYKEFKRPISHQNPFNRKLTSNPKNDNFFYFRLRNKNSFIHKNDFRNKYLDTFNPYVTMMMTNATNLTQYNHTDYVVNNITNNKNTEYGANATEYNVPKKKKFFGLEGKTPLYDNDLYETNTENFKMSSINDLYMKTTMGIGMKTMSELNTKYTNNNNYNNKTTYNKNNLNNLNERHFTFEDDEMANTIFFDGNLKKEDRILAKEDRHKFYKDHFIDKKLTFEELNEIEKNLGKKNDIKIRNMQKRDYRDPFKSKKILKINSQMSNTVEKIRLDLQFQKFQKEYDDICKFNIKNNRMPSIKIQKKNLHPTEEEMNNLNKHIKSKKKSVIEKEFLYQNMKDFLNSKMKDNFVDANNKFIRYDHSKEEFKLDVGILKIRHHPILRTFSAICYDEFKGILYLYGGLGGKIFGDVWMCKYKFDIKKIVWEQIYYPPDNFLDEDNIKFPMPRYGHTMHLVNNKLYIFGGEFYEWQKDKYKKDFLWIYDLDKNEWELGEHKSNLIINPEEQLTSKNKSKNDSRLNFKNIKKEGRQLNIKFQKFKDRHNILSPKNIFKKNKFFEKEEKKVPFPNKKIRLKTVNINSIKTRKKIVDIKDIEDSENNRLLDDDDFRVLYPCLRKNHISLLVGNHIFIYGGIDSNNNFLNDCWIYDLSKRKWDLLDFRGRYPPPLGFHSCCIALEKEQLNSPMLSVYNKPSSNRKTLPLLKLEGIFFFGGINETKIPTNLFFQMTIGFKPAVFEIPPTNGKPPSPRICASMDFSPQCNMIFIHGGKNDFVNDIHMHDIVMLDLQTLNWIHPITNNFVPPARAEHFSTMIGNQVVIFGGSNAESLLNFDFMMINVDI
jgi:hypothetical protein